MVGLYLLPMCFHAVLAGTYEYYSVPVRTV